MKSFHQFNWIISISLSILATSFTLAACSPKAPKEEPNKSDVTDIAAKDDAAAGSDTKDGASAPKTETTQNADAAQKADNADEAQKADNADATPKAEAENDNAPQAEGDDSAQAGIDQTASQPPIAKSIDDEFEFPKCMVCRYCEKSLWASGSECRLSADQVDKVIEKGAVNQWNEYGQTPLMLANDLKSVQKLIAAGASPNHTDEFGNDAMVYAQTKEVQQELIKAGYKTDPDQAYALYTPKPYNKIDDDLGYHIKEARKKASKPSPKIDKYMFNRNYTWSDGDAAIGLGYRDDRIIRGWIKNGNDVNAKDKKGRTPLFYINYPKEARLLLAAGADINAQDNDGNTPLIWFMTANHFDDVYPDDSITKEIIKVLIAAGADTTIKNNAGLTAKDYEKL